MGWQIDLVDALRQRYAQLGTQESVAAACGVSQPTVANILNGRTKPENVRLGVCSRLFPDLEISFYAWQRPSQAAMDLAHAYDALPAAYQAKLLETLAEIRRARDREEAAARRQRPDAETA